MKAECFKKNVVVMGGGTGSFVVLSGLKHYPLDLTAVVTVTDDGGSTGRLRDEYGFLPVGDARQCIVALSEDENWLSKLMLYRFDKGKELKGHNLGNLILTALEDITGSESKALERADEIFALKGQVLPVSLQLVKLAAQYESGKTIISEHKIEVHDLKNDKIKRIYTIPKAHINPSVEKEIHKANLIILGPGDLFNSTIANLIIDGVSESITKSKAKIVYVINLMTLKSQTNGLTAADHVRTLEQYLGKKVDYIIVNNQKISRNIRKLYEESEEYPVLDDLGDDPRVIREDLLAEKVYRKTQGDELKRSLLRHSAQKLAATIFRLLL